MNVVKWEKHDDLPELWLEPHAEDFYVKEERVAFSPITANLLSMDNIALLFLIAKLSKTPEGMKTLERIILRYLQSCTKIIEAIQDSCASNWLTALNNQHLSVAIAHRIGLIDDGGYLKIVDHYRHVFDKMLVKGYVTDTVGSLVTLVQGSKTAGVAGGTGASGLGAIATILKSMGT